MSKFSKRLGVAAVISTALFSMSAFAQFHPTKPVRFIISVSAGGGPDSALRTVAQLLSEKWKQPVLVDNKPGGNGFVAINAFKGQRPDGHELYAGDGFHVITHPHTFRKLPYDPVKDLEPVRSLMITNFFVAVPKNSPYNTLDELIQGATRKEITCGSYFVGSPAHLGCLKLQSLTKTKMLHVPYKDIGQLYTSLSTGEVDWALGSIASAGGLEQSGRLKFIAVASAKRFPAYPNVPAASESSSAKGFDVSGWTAIFAPKGTPKDIKEKIANDLSEVLSSDRMVERYKALGYQDPGLKTDALAAQIVKESAEWKTIVEEAGIRLDE